MDAVSRDARSRHNSEIETFKNRKRNRIAHNRVDDDIEDEIRITMIIPA